MSALAPPDASDFAPGKVVEVVESIRSKGIPAIFVEPQFRPDVIEQVAGDAGVAVGTIYSDLPDSNPPNYIEMMRANAISLANHLRQ